MPKLAVIHLSDVHVRSKAEVSFRMTNAIAESTYEVIRDSAACLLAVTGDIAYSGKASEYEWAASNLIVPLLAAIKQETGKAAYVAIVPGNHDCNLAPDNELREVAIQAVVEDPSKAESKSIVDACTSAQLNFFSFLKSFLNPATDLTSPLLWQQSFDVEGRCIRVSSLNAAWMSRLSEKQGQLVFPIEQFESRLAESACLHLALVHHPFNWYGQSAYQRLRQRLRRSCTAVLSGHEHIGNTGKIEEQLSGSSLFFEAAAIKPHSSDEDAGYSVYQFDLEHKKVTARTFSLCSAGIKEKGAAATHTWSDEGLVHGALDMTSTFSHELNDAGGNFTHSAKERLALEDIFVWPDIRLLDREDRNEKQVASASMLIRELERGERVIVYGEDKAGRSTLLRWCFREFVSHGFAPTFCSASELNVKDEGDVRKKVEQAVRHQFRNPDDIARLPKAKRILLVDDIDRLRSGMRNLKCLTQYVEKHFGGICLTASSEFEVTNVTSKEAIEALAGYTGYELMRFGLRLRYQLIQKWCSLASVNSKVELDRKVDDVESIVNSVIGKRLVPEQPLYLLILLQSCEQHRHGEIQNSGLSFYYQFLITKSLGEVGVKPIELDEYFNYLSMLAWRFQGKGVKELERVEIGFFNADFSRRFVDVDLQERLDLLTRARILAKRGECFSFAYPYIYFFFVGRYLSRNLDNPEIRAWVEEACKKLFLHEKAHAIMFLTHHSENRWVVKLICDVLRECFSGKQPIELNDDIACFNELVELSSQLTLSPPNVEQNQIAVREVSDALMETNEHEDFGDKEALDFAAKWNLLHKTAEILGQILKNHYGSLERLDKHDMLREVFNGSLRALRIWCEEVALEIGPLVAQLKSELTDENPRLSEEVAERRIKRRIFDLIGAVATGVVASAAHCVAAEKLREDVRAVVNENYTNAYRLIEAATRLLKPGAPPLDLIKKLARDLDGNPYAFGVLQSLGFVHMYMFHTDEVVKQSLSETLKISFAAAKAIELKKPGRTLG